MFKDLKEGQTNYCKHRNKNTSGICDECLVGEKSHGETCPECDGDGFKIGSEAGHGCNGTDEDCSRTCPIQVQIQVGCECCGNSGRILIKE